MSQCIVPNWNLRHQRQEQVEGEEGNRSSHVHYHQPNPSHHVPMSNYEVAELTWENGQLAMHRLGGLLPAGPIKSTWGRTGDTLESIVHQATCHKKNLNLIQHDQNPATINTNINGAPSGGKWADQSSSGKVPVPVPELVRKRTRSESDRYGRNFSSSSIREEHADLSACASASASDTFCRDNDTTMMTWASFESSRSLKTKATDEDSACDIHGGSENRDEEKEIKGKTGRSHPTRRIRAAAVHNQSERRRRDRINQRMKALQKLVPNASKTDKASMLDEVIEYLKQLQAQVQMMSSVRSMPQMMMPIGSMQQHIQMTLLARMGMGVGLGMGMGLPDMNTIARTAAPHQPLSPLLHPTSVVAAAPTFVPPPFVIPTMIPAHNNTPPQQPSDPSTNAPAPLHDPFYAFLAQQSMNIDLYNKMAALYRQQLNQTTQAITSSLSQPNQTQGD